MTSVQTDQTRIIVLAIDYSACSSRALKWTAINLVADGDRIFLVHAVNEEHSITTDIEFGEMSVVAAEQSLREKIYERANFNSKEWRESFLRHTSKKVEVSVIVEYGSPGPLIIAKAEALDATMIVCGSHGKGTLSEIFMGSVSTYCLHHAKVPVLVVNKPN
ncbi:hypothetical protein HK098_006805 [Nowakowskiella sp. JEL0407]|nr:hypothetical protein HK098_006805 [Nowakowskiella sp. JEL0407]